MIKKLNNLSVNFLYFAFFLSILWDLYHPIYGKIFDIIGYIFIFCSLFVKSFISDVSYKFNTADLFWKIPILFISLYSSFFFPLISFSIVSGILCSFFLPIYFRDEFKNYHFYNIIKALFLFLFFTQLIQIFLYFSIGYNLDFGGLIGFNNSRNEGGDFFRASGILAEANAIVVTQSILFLMLNRIKRNNLIMIIYFISLIISFSMLGIGIAFIFFILLQLQNLKFFKFTHIFSLLIVLTLLLLIFYKLGYLQIVYDIYKFRLDADSNDISLYLRLFRPTKIPLYELLFPHSYDIANEIVPSNAYYIGLYFWGLFFIYFIFRVLFYFNKNYILYLVFLSILLSYQMYSSLLFWIFISFLITYKTNDVNYVKKTY
jgi:hypothetical protein